MSATILLLVIALVLLAYLIARRWYIAYRAERQLNVEQLLRRGFKAAGRLGWVK